VRRLDARQPVGPDTEITTVIDTPEAAAREKLAGTLPDVIALPDERQRTKTVTSGSATRKRRHLEQFRTDDDEHAALQDRARECGLSFGAFMRAWKLGDAGPRAQRRKPVDVQALTAALVADHRNDNNLNQIARAANTLALVAQERGSDQLAYEVRELRQQLEQNRQDRAAPRAALLAALQRDSEG